MRWIIDFLSNMEARRWRAVLATALLLAGAASLVLAGPALAQDAAADDAGAAEGNVIIVTATKRDTTIQDVRLVSDSTIALTVAGDSQGIHHILFENNRYDAKGREHWQRDAHALRDARGQLLEYLRGERMRFEALGADGQSVFGAVDHRVVATARA